ncbi:UDP-N-acetylglucosamine 2-epimerase [Butyrivibrio sp. JL13D10]|uniref:UDP-N-acetylglucosamine 2-epimerase n=1 Tax=Butyrivibrio sp. JL13D10 TaxID=3236815 RepID=UPI0038B4D492
MKMGDSLKTLVIVTSSRAEYGLLRPVIIRFQNDPDIELKLVVTGTHLSEKYGMTVREIESDGVTIDARIDIMGTSAELNASAIMARALTQFAEYYDKTKPDALMVLGDRYEIFAICAAATNARIPIFHIHGGETTEGAVDEAFRHSITKMSYLHFTATERYRMRVIQLGESPDRVYNVGALGVENALNTELMSKEELAESVMKSAVICNQRYAIGTFHPVTLEDNSASDQINELLKALGKHDDIFYIFTSANADDGGDEVNRILKEYEAGHDNFVLVSSLGMRRYLSALKYAEFVIGNSSSGIIEAPSFRIPTINIGDRQKGRIQADTVINCGPEENAISKAIDMALSDSFKGKIHDADNPYGNGETSEKIVKIAKDYLLNNKIDLKKRFYDVCTIE